MTRFAPVLLTIAALAVAGSAGAATTPSAKAKPVSAATAKRNSCQAEWKAQKTHTGSHKAFMKACIAKG